MSSAVLIGMLSHKFSSIRFFNASKFVLLLCSFGGCWRVIMGVLMVPIIAVWTDAISRLGFTDIWDSRILHARQSHNTNKKSLKVYQLKKNWKGSLSHSHMFSNKEQYTEKKITWRCSIRLTKSNNGRAERNLDIIIYNLPLTSSKAFKINIAQAHIIKHILRNTGLNDIISLPFFST